MSPCNEPFFCWNVHCFSFKQKSGFFTFPTINILWSVLGGERLSVNDGEFMTILQKISKLFRTGNPSGDVLDVFPFLRFIMPGLAGYRERKIGTESTQHFMRVSKCNSKYKRTAWSITGSHFSRWESIPASYQILTPCTSSTAVRWFNVIPRRLDRLGVRLEWNSRDFSSDPKTWQLTSQLCEHSLSHVLHILSDRSFDTSIKFQVKIPQR